MKGNSSSFTQFEISRLMEILVRVLSGVCVCVCVCVHAHVPSVMSDSLQPHGL